MIGKYARCIVLAYWFVIDAFINVPSYEILVNMLAYINLHKYPKSMFIFIIYKCSCLLLIYVYIKHTCQILYHIQIPVFFSCINQHYLSYIVPVYH